MKSLTVYIETPKELKIVDKLIKEYDIKPYNYDLQKDKIIIQNFNNYVLTDVRNDCFQYKIKYEEN